jgi:hypothetical protein
MPTLRIRLPQDPPFQVGLSLSVLGPFLTGVGGLGAISAWGASWEVGLMWGVLHIVAFGALQVVWILPVAAVGAVLGARRFALGLLVGGAIVLAANGVSYLVGLRLGAW